MSQGTGQGEGKAQRKYPGWRQESSPYISSGSQGTGQGGAGKSTPGLDDALSHVSRL